MKSAIVPADEKVGFDYLVIVDVVKRTTVEEATRAIHLHMSEAHEHFLEVGRALSEVQENMEHGQWLLWLEREFEWSEDTARNYQNAANVYDSIEGEIPPRTAFHKKALYLLGSNKTAKVAPQAKQTAVQLALEGETVDLQTATILSRAPKYLVDLFVAKKVTKKNALSTMYALRKVTPQAKALCIETGVTNATVVMSIDVAWRYPDRKRWDDLVRDRALIGNGWSVSLGDANERDWQRWMRERQQERIEINSVVVKEELVLNKVKARLVSSSDGLLTLELARPLLNPLPDGTSLRITVVVTTEPDAHLE